jgi:nicotinamide-nucleotide amidase
VVEHPRFGDLGDVQPKPGLAGDALGRELADALRPRASVQAPETVVEMLLMALSGLRGCIERRPFIRHGGAVKDGERGVGPLLDGQGVAGSGARDPVEAVQAIWGRTRPGCPGLTVRAGGGQDGVAGVVEDGTAAWALLSSWFGFRGRQAGNVSAVDEQEQVAEQIAATAQRRRLRVAVAESLTGGLVASRLAAAPDASSWFRGAVVAYASDVKHNLLRVPAGPVVSETAAATMAASVSTLLGADVALAVTGVGGPEPQDDEPPGTVWLAVHHGHQQRTELRRIGGDNDPAAICANACTDALRLLLESLDA